MSQIFIFISHITWGSIRRSSALLDEAEEFIFSFKHDADKKLAGYAFFACKLCASATSLLVKKITKNFYNSVTFKSDQIKLLCTVLYKDIECSVQLVIGNGNAL